MEAPDPMVVIPAPAASDASATSSVVAPVSLSAVVSAAKAKAIAAVTGTPAATNTETDKKTPAVTPAKIEMDAATLKQLTKLAKADRENRAKLTALESDSKEVADLKTARKLFADGKHLEALAMISGKDALEQFEAIQTAYLNAPIGEEKDALAEKVDTLAAKIAADDKAKADAATAALTEAEKQRDTGIRVFANSVLDDAKGTNGAPLFEICSQPKNRVEAATAALAVVKVLAIAKYPDGNVSVEQARELYREAYAEVEAEYEASFAESLGSRFVKRDRPRSVDPRPTASSSGPRVEPQNRPSPTLAKPAISTTPPAKSLTPAQARQRAIDAIRGYGT